MDLSITMMQNMSKSELHTLIPYSMKLFIIIDREAMGDNVFFVASVRPSVPPFTAEPYKLGFTCAKFV